MEPRASGTILVVDDDHDVLDAIRAVLEREGYRVVEATNGVEAQAVLDATPVDLVLLDLVMPGMNGWDFLDGLSGEHPKVIVISAAPTDVEPSGRLRGVLKKPFECGALLASIARQLRSGGVSR